MSYYPRRPVKSFQDLEVYQKTLSVAAIIVKHILKETPENQKLNGIVEHLVQYLLDLPVYISTAHSVRFSSPQTAIDKLERAMLNCNLAVVYLELYRDIVVPLSKNSKSEIRNSKQIQNAKSSPNSEIENYEDHIRTLLTCRGKIIRLQMSWKKFMKQNESG